MEENQPAHDSRENLSEKGDAASPAPAASASAASASAKPVKQRRRRRWPWLVGAILVLLLVLVLILPTLIASAIGRSMLVGQVNERINGKLQLGGLSLGWFTPIRADGVVIFDASGRQILQLEHLSTGLTVLDAIRGRYNLGKTQVDGLDILVSRGPDGSLNWSHLPRSAEPGSPSPAAAQPEPTAGNSKTRATPVVNGELVVAHSRVTYEDRSAAGQSGGAGKSAQAGISADERFNTDSSGTVLVSGGAEVSDLVVDGQPNAERSIRLTNDVSLAGGSTLDVRSANLVASTTNAWNIGVRGKVDDLNGRRQIADAMTIDLGYDLDALRRVVEPLLTPEQRKSLSDVKWAGKYNERFVASGGYPANEPAAEAIQKLILWGAFQFDQFSADGVTLQNASLPVDLAGGIARVQYHGKPAGQNLPPAIACNGGSLNLGGAAVDLRGAHTLLTTPTGLKVLDKVSLNPLFASTFLGKYLNNPMFANAAEASGLCNLTAQSCDQLAVDDLGAGLGTATLDLTIGTLQLGNPEIARVLPQAVLGSLRGEVPAYHIQIAKGILTQDFALNLLRENRPLKLTGQVDLKTKQMLSTTLELPWALFAVKDASLQKYLPEGIKIPFTGRSDSPVPALDVNQAIRQSLGQAGQNAVQDQLLGKTKLPAGGDAQNALKTLQGILHKPGAQDGTGAQPEAPAPAAPASQPAPQRDDPLKSLGDLLKKKK